MRGIRALRMAMGVLSIMALVLVARPVAAWAGDKDDKPKADGSDMPQCDKKIGTLAVDEPENKWWTALNLESPEALLKVFVQNSHCFTLVDRGKGLQMAEKERALASNGEMRGGSNIGKGQMKAADHVLVPDIANQNANSGGKHFGAALGGLMGHKVGALVGG